MRLVLILALLSLFPFCRCVQSKSTLNTSLKRELDSIFVLDQKYRELMSLDKNQYGDSLANVLGVKKENIEGRLWFLQSAIDSSNIVSIEKIIQQYGYPGKSLVGEPANEAAFYIIQHSDVIDKYLDTLKIAAGKSELPFKLYAMMLDRSLMGKNEEQIYGSQAAGRQVKNIQTGQKEMTWFIWPIKNADSVNFRRKQAGFELTVEQNAKRMGIDYKALTLEDVNKMIQQ